MKLRGLLAAVAVSTGIATSASAIVTYDSDAMSTFTLIDSDGMAISYETGPELPTTTTIGTGIATIDADSQTPSGMGTLSLDDSIVQISNVSGSADAPGGTSDATVLNSVLITLDNTGGTTEAVAEFTFLYEWATDVSKTDSTLEAGFAAPFFHLSGFSPSGVETLEIDEGMGAGKVSVDEWLVDKGIGFPHGEMVLGGMDSGSTTVTAFVTVPAGSIDSFSVITDSSGGAVRAPESAVPEPMSAALGAMGLTVLGFATKRRRGA